MKMIYSTLIAALIFCSFQLSADDTEVNDDLAVIVRTALFNPDYFDQIVMFSALGVMEEKQLEMDMEQLIALFNESLDNGAIERFFYEPYKSRFNEEEIRELRNIFERPTFQKYMSQAVDIGQASLDAMKGMIGEIVEKHGQPKAEEKEVQVKNLEKLNSKNFDDVVLKSDKPAVVFVCAKWCRPCKLLKPIIDQLVEEMDENFLFAKVDFDKNESFCKKRLKVKRLPSILFFKDGKIIERHEGFMTIKDLKKMIKQLLSN